MTNTALLHCYGANVDALLPNRSYRTATQTTVA